MSAVSAQAEIYMNILSCQPGFIPCLTEPLPPLEHCASFWSGLHDHAQPLLALQPFAVAQSQTLTDLPDEA